MFLFVLAGGYFSLLFKSAKRGDNFGDWNEWKKNWHEEKARMKKEMKDEIRKMKSGRAEPEVEWKDIGNEFKLALYNIGHSINRAFERSGKNAKGESGRKRKKK